MGLIIEVAGKLSLALGIAIHLSHTVAKEASLSSCNTHRNMAGGPKETQASSRKD